MGKPTVSVPDELLEQVHGQLRGMETRSGWLREAIRYRLTIDSIADEFDADLDEEAVSEAIEQYLAENDLDDSPPKAEP
jgi:metal-responsive CopG/Arc/MetJ family transcriptional regulator